MDEVISPIMNNEESPEGFHILSGGVGGAFYPTLRNLANLSERNQIKSIFQYYVMIFMPR